MKLSDAILMGSLACPKAIGDRHAPDGSKCALGAAEYAMGKNSWDDKKPLAQTIWPWAFEQRAPHPVLKFECDVSTIIATLNNGEYFCDCPGDYAKFEPWTRERIAEWVATLEPQETPVSSEASEFIPEIQPVGGKH